MQQTIEQPESREVRLNLPGTDKKHCLCPQPDGKLCFFFASDGYALFHGHAAPADDGIVTFPNMYTEDRLGTPDVHCGDTFVIGVAGGSIRLRIDGESWKVLEHDIGTILPSLLTGDTR